MAFLMAKDLTETFGRMSDSELSRQRKQAARVMAMAATWRDERAIEQANIKIEFIAIEQRKRAK